MTGRVASGGLDNLVGTPTMADSVVFVRGSDGMKRRCLTGDLIGANSSATGVVAMAGGGQANATQITANINLLSTVAANGDSVKLPAAIAGREIVITNNGSSIAAAAFPAVGESINQLAANVAVTLPKGQTISFVCPSNGIWKENGMLPEPSKYNTASLSGTTITQLHLSGADICYYINTNAAPGTLTTRNASQLFGDDAFARVGRTWTVVIGNTGAGTLTLAAGANVTINGTLTILTGTTRTFQCVYGTASAVTMTSVGTGTIS